MPELRKIVDERDARACLSAVKRSGDTLRAWAQRNQVDGRSLHAWQNNLMPRGGTKVLAPPPPRLVELVPAPKDIPRRYVVRVGECSVEVGDDFEPATLARLVSVLRGC